MLPEMASEVRLERLAARQIEGSRYFLPQFLYLDHWSLFVLVAQSF